MKIAFIGFGEAARAFTDTLRTLGPQEIAAFDIIDSPEMTEAMARREVRQGRDPGDAVAGADWIFSAVTADQSLAAARSVLEHLVQGQIFVDINSVSPGRKKQTAEEVVAHGGRYLDMAVMAPVHPRGHATPVLLAGVEAAALAGDLSQAGFALDIAGDTAGEATAIKMVRSNFVKGLEAITVETALAAAASGCFEEVMSSLAKSFPGLGWPDNIAYNFERTLKHGKRRAAEMRESAATLDALGLSGGLAAETAEIQQRMGDLPIDDLPEGELAGAVAKVAELRRAKNAT